MTMLSKKNARLFCLSIVFTMSFTPLASARMVSIKGSEVNLRTGPSLTDPVKFEYGDGFPLQVVSEKGDWIKVSDFENDGGWVHKSVVTSEPHMIVKVNKNSTKKINIRREPSTSSDVIGEAYYGVVFKTLEHNNDWVKVHHETGLTGWISRRLLWGF